MCICHSSFQIKDHLTIQQLLEINKNVYKKILCLMGGFTFQFLSFFD